MESSYELPETSESPKLGRWQFSLLSLMGMMVLACVLFGIFRAAGFALLPLLVMIIPARGAWRVFERHEWPGLLKRLAWFVVTGYFPLVAVPIVVLLAGVVCYGILSLFDFLLGTVCAATFTMPFTQLGGAASVSLFEPAVVVAVWLLIVAGGLLVLYTMARLPFAYDPEWALPTIFAAGNLAKVCSSLLQEPADSHSVVDYILIGLAHAAIMATLFGIGWLAVRHRTARQRKAAVLQDAS